VVVGDTFYAASTVEVTVRSTVIDTLVVGSTERHASVGERIAVRLAGDFTSVDTRSALVIGRSSSTRITTTIGTTVSSVGWAIGVLLARSASSVGLTGRLSGNGTTIERTAVGVGCASLASSVGLTVLSASVVIASLVVGLSIASVRIAADSVRQANGVRAHWERSIVGSAVGVRSTNNASTIFHAISSYAIVVGSTSRVANRVRANSVVINISTPCVTGSAISVVSAVKADTIRHAVGTLST